MFQRPTPLYEQFNYLALSPQRLRCIAWANLTVVVLKATRREYLDWIIVGLRVLPEAASLYIRAAAE
jgi:hypothetical protein